MAYVFNKDERKKQLEAEATPAPTLKTLPTTPNKKYENGKWDESSKGNAALGAYTDAKDAVTAHNNKGFTFSNNDWLQSVLGDIKNFKDFSYDINGDALYQQYKDKYIQQGKMAKTDTMGQAAAMTGGYGNSYAQSVGQQAYQGQLQNLNDIVPELYQMALDKYSMDKQNLYDQYSLLMSEFEREYGLHSDEYNKLLDALGIAKDDYYSGADMFYTEQNNTNNILDKQFANDMAIWEAENANLWNQAEWDEGLRQYIDGVLYQEGRDAVEDERWQLQYGNAIEDNTKLYDGTTEDGKGYHNDGLTKAQVKELQAFWDLPTDGYFGAEETEMAGGLNAKQAYEDAFGKLEEGDIVLDDLKDVGYTQVETTAMQSFRASMPTKRDMAKLSPSEKQKYGSTYEKYVEAKIDEWYQNGKLTEDEVASLLASYGLLD